MKKNAAAWPHRDITQKEENFLEGGLRNHQGETKSEEKTESRTDEKWHVIGQVCILRKLPIQLIGDRKGGMGGK